MCGLLAAGCDSTPVDPSEFAGASSDAAPEVGSLADTSSTADSTTADSTTADSATADSSSADAQPSETSGTTGDSAAAGPACHAALSCLVAKKLWTKGGPPPRNLACTKDMTADETAQMDAVTTCAAKACGDELDAWDKGGAAEQNALYKCLISQCTTKMAHCIGGHGATTCAKAIQCLNKCGTFNEPCATGCVAPTSEPHAGKTGAFLECVLAKCDVDKLATCDIPLSCAIYCPELGG